MKLSNTLALAFAISSAGPIAAYAQTAAPTVPYHHYRYHRFQDPHNYVHHHFVAHNRPRSSRRSWSRRRRLRLSRSAWLSRPLRPTLMARATKTD